MDNIPVCIRVRPLNERENSLGDYDCWQIKENTIVAVNQGGQDQVGSTYSFDRCFEPSCTTPEVYDQVVQRIIQAAMTGYNGTVFCYGQTSGGKTYTMYGTEENPGIVRLAARDIYSIIESTPEREYYISAAMVEIYNENIRDLLGRRASKLREDYHGRIILDAEKKAVSTPEQILAVLLEGERQASRTATNMNNDSSRSHTIFRVYIESKARTTDEDTAQSLALQSELNLVDLAGSECAALTGAEGTARREGACINKSLLALSTVIEKLSSMKPGSGNGFINFRDSILTRMLQNALGGNSKTAIVCNISPAASNYQQTNSTILFASRAKKIRNSAKINEVTDDKTQLKKCKREISDLKKLLSAHETKMEGMRQSMQERDDVHEKVRELEDERSQMAKKLDAYVKMISVSNQPMKLMAKSEPFNRRFTLACNPMRPYLFSPVKQTLSPTADDCWRLSGWAGRASVVSTMSDSDAVLGRPSGILMDARLQETIDKLEAENQSLKMDNQVLKQGIEGEDVTRQSKKRKRTSLDAEVQCGSSPNVDEPMMEDADAQAAQTEQRLRAAVESLTQEVAEKDTELRRMREEFSRVTAELQASKDMSAQTLKYHDSQLQELHSQIANLKSQLQGSPRGIEPGPPQNHEREALEQRFRQTTLQLEQVRSAAAAAEAQKDTEIASMARTIETLTAELTSAIQTEEQVQGLNNRIAYLQSQIEASQAALNNGAAMQEIEQHHVQVVEAIAEMKAAGLALQEFESKEGHGMSEEPEHTHARQQLEQLQMQLQASQTTIADKDEELQILRGNVADLKAQVAMGAVGQSDVSLSDSQAEEVDELRRQVDLLQNAHMEAHSKIQELTAACQAHERSQQQSDNEEITELKAQNGKIVEEMEVLQHAHMEAQSQIQELTAACQAYEQNLKAQEIQLQQQSVEEKIAELDAFNRKLVEEMEQAKVTHQSQVQALQHANQQIGVLELKLQETSSEQMTRSSEAQEVQHLSVKLAEKEATLKDLQARLDAALKQNTEDTNQHQQVAQGREQCIQQLNARVSTLQEQLSHAQEQDLARQRSLAEAQTVVEEQERSTAAKLQECREQMQAQATAQMGELSSQVEQLTEKLVQKEGHSQSLQEELDNLKTQHGAILREMAAAAAGPAPTPRDSKKMPMDKLREDNAQMQKQLQMLKNEVLTKDRKLKCLEKAQESKAKDLEKLTMKGKASEEVLKQLKQEKNVAVQEATKKDAESRDMKRKLERIEKESEKYNANIKAEKDKLKAAQEELGGVQKLLHVHLVEKQQLKDAEDQTKVMLSDLQQLTQQQQNLLQQEQSRIADLEMSERTLTGNLDEMTSMNQKLQVDVDTASARIKESDSQLQGLKDQLSALTLQSQKTERELTSKVEFLQQQLVDTNEMHDLLSKERSNAESEFQDKVEEVKRLQLDKQAREQVLLEKSSENDKLVSQMTEVQVLLQEQQQIVQEQKVFLEAQGSALATSRADLHELSQKVEFQQQELDEGRNIQEVLKQEKEQLGVQCEAARAEVAELKEQQLEAEEETKQLTHKVLELETDRDTWQLERENLSAELDDSREQHKGLHQKLEETKKSQENLEEQLQQARSEMDAKAVDLRTMQMEMAEKDKEITSMQAEMQNLDANWKADIQSYMQEFAQKERHFAKIQAEHKYLTEEVEALRKAEGQRSKETESVTHLHKETVKAHATEISTLNAQLEGANKQVRSGQEMITRLEKELTAAQSQVAQLPAAQKAVLAAHQEKDKLQKSLDEACAQVLSAEDAIEQKDKDMLDLEGRLAEAVGGITEWKDKVARKEQELNAARVQTETLTTQLQDAQENVVLKEGQINDLLSQATELKVQQAAAEQKIQRLERSMQGMHQDVLELTKDRNTIQLVVAQKEGEEKVLQTQLQKVTEQVKQAESHVAQKESDLEALRVQHVEQVQQLNMKVEELQASGVASQEQATAVSMELAASRDANAALQSTLEAERRMHQRKVDHMEEALQFAKKTVTQTEHQSQSQMVAHRRQTMSMCTTESQLKRAQSEKQEIEERLKQKQSDLDALQSRLSDAQNQMSQLQQAAQDMRSQQAEVKEECQYYQGRTQELEAQVTGTLKLLDQQKEDAKARHQKELQKLKRKHELQLKNCEERYNMLKTKATQQLDRFQKVNARKSLGGLDVLGKENTLTGSEKVRVETEPLNLTEGERRRPRRTSVPRVPLANRTNMETSPKIRSQYDSDSETDSEKTFTGLGPEFEETAFVGGCLSDGEQTPLK